MLYHFYSYRSRAYFVLQEVPIICSSNSTSVSCGESCIFLLNFVAIAELEFFNNGSWVLVVGAYSMLVLQMLMIIFVSREFRHDRSNRSWWSGKWATAGLGWYIITQPLREAFCKLTEMSYFAGDLIATHIILYAQIPILLIPYADKWHTLMLFWLKPSNQIRPRILSKRQKRRRIFQANLYLIIFVFGFVLFSSIFVLPIVANKYLDIDFTGYIPKFIHPIVQPNTAPSNKKGLRRGLEIKHY